MTGCSAPPAGRARISRPRFAPRCMSRGRASPKLREGGLLIVRAGGGAGMFSAILPGWAATGPIGSIPVTREVRA